MLQSSSTTGGDTTDLRAGLCPRYEGASHPSAVGALSPCRVGHVLAAAAARRGAPQLPLRDRAASSSWLQRSTRMAL